MLHAEIAAPPRPRGRTLSADLVAINLGLLDGLLMFLPPIALYALYVGWSRDTYPIYVAIALANTFLTVMLFYLSDLYRLDAIAKPVRHVRKLLPLMGCAFLLVLAFLFALKLSGELSRVWMFACLMMSAALVLTGRVAVSHAFIRAARAGELSCNIVVVGGGEHGSSLVRHIKSLGDPWNKIVGVFDDRSERVGPDVAGVPVLGNLDDLLVYAREHRCDEVLVALPWSAESRVMEIVAMLRVLPVHVSLGPDLAGLNFLPTSYRECGGVPVLEILRKPIAGWHETIKRAEDFVIGGLITLAALPLMLGIALLIKLDSRGPVLFRQPRYGFNNQLINVYKFRTMYADRSDAKGSTLTARNDPRITRIGRFLRRSSLDELPQFFNVLKGEMSIVGPRPHAVEAKAGSRLYQDVVAEYAARHRVKPGITGWAQVNGWRGETDRDEQILQRVRHDMHYIENWSLKFDISISLRTIGTVIGARNAM